MLLPWNALILILTVHGMAWQILNLKATKDLESLIGIQGIFLLSKNF